MVNSSTVLKENSLKPLVYFAIGTIVTCLYFWLSSRYPDLNSKASLGPDAPISSLGFSPVMHITENDGFWHKVIAETVNWANTNKKGMSFAFVVGAFFLCVLPLFKKPRTGIGSLDSLLGFVFGAPLGVCVNCAAPISKSMLAAGASVQFSLSVLITSPTMNVVVLMMAFTFFPAFLVGLKIIFTILFALVFVPLGCRYFFKNDVDFVHSHLAETQNITHESCEDIPQGWLGAFIWSVKIYGKNFIYLLKVALPLMVLAGFLGSLLSIIIPWDQIQTIDSSFDKSWMLLFLLFAIAVFGAFLPCPISFDIVLASTLLMAGVPMHYVAVFLFTLGTYSIYAFFIVWQSVSAKAAFYMYMCTVILGVLVGLLTLYITDTTQVNISKQIQSVQKTEATQKDAAVISGQADDDDVQDAFFDPVVPRDDIAFTYSDIKSRIASVERSAVTNISLPEGLRLYSSPFKKLANTQTGFKFETGDKYGILQPYEVSYMSYIPVAIPHATMGIASGDVHNDGWPDILMTGDLETSPNLILYTNVNGEEFMRQRLPHFGGDNAAVVVSIIDLNADGWSDIFVTTMNGEVHIIYNDNGEFSLENSERIIESSGVAANVSFGDIEGDGDIDIFLGYWSAGPKFLNQPESRNYILFSDGAGQYKEHALTGHTGETLTSLFEDFDQDGILDLYVGNDNEIHSHSDQVYKIYDNGETEPMDIRSIPGFTGAASTMSIDKGDIDNDLLPDYYIGQIAYSGQFEHAIRHISERQISVRNYCSVHSEQTGQSIKDCNKDMALKKALGRVSFMNADDCYTLMDDRQKTKCLIHYQSYSNFCIQGASNPSGVIQNKASKRYKEFCAKTIAEEDYKPPQDGLGLLKRADFSRSNVLLRSKDDAENLEYRNEALDSKTGYGAWTWNSRFADLDNDGWQDLYVANGFNYLISRSMNIFYRNMGNGVFEDTTKEFSLDSFSPTSAYTFIDYNRDGFQDIISVPTDSAVEVFTSQGGGNAIRFVLHDENSRNSQSFGTQIIVNYQNEQGVAQKQIQELKATGGYRSYNEPVLHFGFGDIEEIESAQITWPDGTVDRIDYPFRTGQTYYIERR